MIDFDVKDGISKEFVPDIISSFLNSQKLLPNNQRLSKSEMCFKLYETDNGVHAFCVSHRIPSYSVQALSLLLKVCSDVWYAAFTFLNGYNIRLTPKVINNKTMQRNPPEIVNAEFVQKEGLIRDGQKIIYVGNESNIDPYLDEITDVILRFQQFILKQENLADRLVEKDPILIETVTNKLIEMYNSMKNKDFDKQSYRWAQVAQTCEFLNQSVLADYLFW